MTSTTTTGRALTAALGTTALLGAGLGAGPAATAAGPQQGSQPAVQQAAQQAAADLTELRTGEELRAGSALVSPSGRYRLVLDTAGVVQLLGRESWLSPATAHPLPLPGPGSGADRLVLQADGNLVAYGPGGRVVLDAGTGGSGAVALRLGDDRELVLLDASGAVVAELGTGVDAVVFTGTVLLPGDVVVGETGTTRLLMQPDGNLVLYRGSTALWSSRTAGNPGAGAVFQDDGNLVVYSSQETGRRVLFATGTGRAPDELTVTLLVVEDTEVSVFRAYEDGGNEAVWGSGWSSNRLEPGDELDPGDRRRSPDGRCELVMQTDYNLVEYCDGRAVFASGVGRFPPLEFGTPVALMQPDGNLVVYVTDAFFDDRPAAVSFATRTSAPGSSLVVQDDRNVVVYAPGGRPTWSARTGRIG